MRDPGEQTETYPGPSRWQAAAQGVLRGVVYNVSLTAVIAGVVSLASRSRWLAPRVGLKKTHEFFELLKEEWSGLAGLFFGSNMAMDSAFNAWGDYTDAAKAEDQFAKLQREKQAVKQLKAENDALKHQNVDLEDKLSGTAEMLAQAQAPASGFAAREAAPTAGHAEKLATNGAAPDRVQALSV
jgi:hypothetical protein